MTDLDYIKEFSKISITRACEKAQVNRQNLLNNKTTKKNIKKVRKVLESMVAELYLLREEEKNDNTRI